MRVLRVRGLRVWRDFNFLSILRVILDILF